MADGTHTVYNACICYNYTLNKYIVKHSPGNCHHLRHNNYYNAFTLTAKTAVPHMTRNASTVARKVISLACTGKQEAAAQGRTSLSTSWIHSHN